MAGGLISLSSYGPQDGYLTGVPQITFFKNFYKRYTPFAIETMELQFNGNPNFGNKATCEISRNADLVGRTFLKVTLPAITTTGGTSAWVEEVGHFLIKEVDFEVGGVRMDRHFGWMLSVFQELWGTSEQKANYDEMIGNTSDLTTASASLASKILYIPLKFWWNREPGNYMPLVALSRHTVKVTIEFEQAAKLIKTTGTYGQASIPSAQLLVDYVFLDVEERRQFARMPHEYLVETVQYSGLETSNQQNYQQRLSLNHPLTELITVCQLVSEVDALNLSNFANSSQDGHNLLNYKLQINSQDYEAAQEGRYKNLVIPYKCHTNGPRTGIYVHSFSLAPEGQQPAGSVNGSRIDNFIIQLGLASSNPTNIMTFGFNKNIFRVMSSQGGLLYSN